MKSLLFNADTNKLRISFTNFYSSIILFTNSSPSLLTFLSLNIDPKRFFALDRLWVTNFKLFERLAFIHQENSLISLKFTYLSNLSSDEPKAHIKDTRWLV